MSAMKVRELIERLQSMEQDARVTILIRGADGGCGNWDDVTVDGIEQVGAGFRATVRVRPHEDLTFDCPEPSAGVPDSCFIIAFANVQTEAYTVNCRNGFWDIRNKFLESGMVGARETVALSCLALVTSEVAEAMEAVRKHPVETWGNHSTKDTVVRELAGTVIRCMDLAERFKLPLATAITAEIAANSKRGYMHGGKAA